MTAEQAEAVVTVEEHNLTQAEAFARLERWAAQTYVDANEAVQLSDAEAGTLVLRGVEQVRHVKSGGATYPLGYRMTMDIRDGRVRFTQVVGEPYISQFMVQYVTETAAANMHAHFSELRTRAMAALTQQDEF